MIAVSLFDSDISCRLCLSLLHSLWQAALLALLTTCAARLWRKMPVEWNYSIHVAALLMAVALVPITYWSLSAAHAATGRVELSAAQVSESAAAEVDTIDASPNQAEPLRRQTPPHAPAAAKAASEVWRAAGLWERAAPFLMAVYAAGVAAMLLRLIVAVTAAERQRRTALPLLAENVSASIGRIARRWGCRSRRWSCIRRGL